MLKLYPSIVVIVIIIMNVMTRQLKQIDKYDSKDNHNRSYQLFGRNCSLIDQDLFDNNLIKLKMRMTQGLL